MKTVGIPAQEQSANLSISGVDSCVWSCQVTLPDEFKNYYRIFTDGSKEGNRVAAAVVHRDNTKCVRLPDAASIFRAELYALLLAIDVVRRSKEKNFVIFSDSMSSLQSINGFNLDSDLVQKFLKDYTVLAKKWQKHYSLLDPKSCRNPR